MMASVVDAVYGVTADPRERAALLFACGAESGCMSIQNRAGAPAYGPWQIYLPYNSGVTVAQANDPTFAASYMYTHHNVPGCVSSQGGLWQTNPLAAATAAARCIEGATSAEPYSQSQIDMGWQMAQPALTGQKTSIPVITGIGNAVLGAGQTIPGISGAANILVALTDPHWWIRVLLIFGGLMFVMIGVIHLTHIDEQAAKIAPAVAMAAA